jgi:hypothetical protein
VEELERAGELDRERGRAEPLLAPLLDARAAGDHRSPMRVDDHD